MKKILRVILMIIFIATPFVIGIYLCSKTDDYTEVLNIALGTFFSSPVFSILGYWLLYDKYDRFFD